MTSASMSVIYLKKLILTLQIIKHGVYLERLLVLCLLDGVQVLLRFHYIHCRDRRNQVKLSWLVNHKQTVHTDWRIFCFTSSAQREQFRFAADNRNPILNLINGRSSLTSVARLIVTRATVTVTQLFIMQNSSHSKPNMLLFYCFIESCLLECVLLFSSGNV